MLQLKAAESNPIREEKSNVAKQSWSPVSAEYERGARDGSGTAGSSHRLVSISLVGLRVSASAHNAFQPVPV
jgi:hypothetical protein